MAIIGLSIGFAPRDAHAWAQITLQNDTPYTLDLYVDGNYGCRALPNMFCTTQIPAGNHTFTAVAAGGQGSISEGPVYIEDGSSPTWTVFIEQQ
ncbi:hypothetical protein FJZ53_01975 [Candidatus Woesearchaeota archaeon]|nr:hypothetical protein [Candidatus Woesearchaeota archaeon]